MNLISFANSTPSENQTSLLPAMEKDGKPEDFSAILSNIFVALQTANSPATNFSSGFEQNNLQVQTVSENGQNFVFGNNSDFAENSFVQTANQDLKTTLNQTFFSPNLNTEIKPSANLKTEIINPTFQTDSTVSFSPTEKLISIPTNFQPIPKLPTMPNLLAENSFDSNLPRVSTPQNALPDIQNIMKLSQIVPENLETQNSIKTEEAKGFEILPKSDDIFSKQRFSLITDLPSNSVITGENIFPETANLPNTNFSVSENPVNVEVAYIKNPQFKPTNETTVIENDFNVLNEKIDYSLKLNQTTNNVEAKSKSANPNATPNLNSVLEYPTKPKVDLSQNPINSKPVEIIENIISNDFPVQVEIQNLQPNVEVKTKSIPEVDMAETLPTEHNNPQIDRKSEIPSTIKPIETKAETSNPEFNYNQNVGEVMDSAVEHPTKLRIDKLVETPQPKVENYDLNLVTIAQYPETIVPAEISNSDFKIPIVSNEVKPGIETPTISNQILPDIEITNIINETPVEVKNYQIKPLDFVSQTGEKIPANQSVQNISPDEVPINESIDEVLVDESINDNSLKDSLPAEKKAVSAATDTAFTLNTEIAEPISTVAPENIVPQINPEKVLTTDFVEKIELPERKAVSEVVKKTVADLNSSLKNQVQNNELPKNQKQTQTQEFSVTESAQTESGIKIAETNSSSSSREFNLNKNPEKNNKFNESENDLTVNFERIFDNVIKKKEAVETTLKTSADPNKITEQITPRLLEMAASVEKKDEKEILRLRLHPAELGTVEITLERDSSGVLNAHFKTETEGAKQALSNGLEMLRENLQKAGWEIGQMDISNGSSNSATDNQNRQNNQQKSEWIENFIFNRSAEQPDESENNSPTRLLNLLA